MSVNSSPKTLAHRVGERWLLFFFLVALIGALIGVWAVLNRWSTPAQMVITAPPAAVATPIPQATNNAPAATALPAAISVLVSGAVQQPGLYTLSAGATVADAIAAAGGLGEQADANGLNLSNPLKDGETLTIPTTSAGNPNAAETKLINLNTATLAELESLPEIGARTAQAIIDNRPYRRLSDLNRVPGIGEATINKLRGLVSFGD